jgi:TrmH family RNA methyltransferase
MPDITSLHNERLKQVRGLQTQARARRQEGLIVVEGVRLIEDALDCGLEPVYVLYLDDEVTRGRPAAYLFARLEAEGVFRLSVTPAVMKAASDVEAPPGILAVLPMPNLPIPAAPTLVLALDGMQNPGNLGSALRAAAAAGVDLVLLAPDTVDPFNPKALRGGMGAHFRLPLLRLDWAAIVAGYGGLAGYVAAVEGETVYSDVDWTRPSLLIVGGEAHGAGAQARRLAAKAVAIPMATRPMAPRTESLNATTAAAVILFEARRQRRQAAHESRQA